MSHLPSFRTVTLDAGAGAVSIAADLRRATTDGSGRAELKPAGGQIAEMPIVELAGIVAYGTIILLVGDVFLVLSGKITVVLSGSGAVAGFTLCLNSNAAIEPVWCCSPAVAAYRRTGAVGIRRGDAGFGVIVLRDSNIQHVIMCCAAVTNRAIVADSR